MSYVSCIRICDKVIDLDDEVAAVCRAKEGHMRHTLPKRAVLSITALGFMAGFCGVPAFAGELTPYNLPSQQRQAVPDMRQQAAPRPASPTVDESYYQRFAAEARTFSPGQRGELKTSFARSRDQALVAGRVDEAQHYSRLLDILQAMR
jgi:hypothetical protein